MQSDPVLARVALPTRVCRLAQQGIRCAIAWRLLEQRLTPPDGRRARVRDVAREDPYEQYEVRAARRSASMENASAVA